MFKSFFPSPKLFFLSFVIWCAVSVAAWYGGGAELGIALFGASDPEAGPTIGLGHFVTPEFLWFYIYFALVAGLFVLFWHFKENHPWELWSVAGSAVILFVTYFNVQVSVAINNWRRPFFDAVQNALSENSTTTAADLFSYIWIFAQLAFLFIAVIVVFRYFVSHWIFRWRTAMNNYYLERWKQVRHIEGASQRVQEDTMRFASIMEGLGVSAVDAVMTLIAFLPILWGLSQYVPEIPFFGAVPQALVWAAIFWSLFGTILLAVAGIRLPGLEFKNQRVEAAFRKELVYGEDDYDRAQLPTMYDLFNDVRRNYFRLYLEYMYFNVFRFAYLQADGIFAMLLLIPSIIAGAAIGFTFGVLQQILTAFGQVSNSFQYLVNSWPTVVDLLSIHKRLKTFEAAIDNEDLPDIDKEWLENNGEVDNAV
ncbi:peptide antibiotic transporter SbmA [Ahrensia marina]|uniref:Microcin B17 transporter n=1 Tax=Ahrensia marina TaxID=1514904 RepID=A0A0N0E7J0_9HYPH|nr:peptide antibiotic transporter SbmA [Ahrensia marina]KPB01251.1 microcin B17 transporter [Ahrensia marina]